jgi:Protein of unknown function (DUF5818)
MTFNMHRTRWYLRALGLASLLVLTPLAASAARIASLDGFLDVNGGCIMLQTHDGTPYSLLGDTSGLLGGDHVRIEGRFVADSRCGATGFEVMTVQTLWADDTHRAVRFDFRGGEPFLRFAQRSGRLGGGYYRDYDRDARALPDRFDRYGHYVYQGPHRRVTLLGRLHEPANGCPFIDTGVTTFSLDGDLGDYQAGDAVRVSGVLYDGDGNAPCGGPTVVVGSIRGH